jgi:hypothetical protein
LDARTHDAFCQVRNQMTQTNVKFIDHRT